MTVSEKAGEKLDEASKEIKEAIDSLRKEGAELKDKVREKIRGSGDEVRESAEELSREVKGLSERVRELIPKRKRKAQAPVSANQYPEYLPDTWAQPLIEFRKATARLFDDFFRSMRWPLPERGSSWGLAGDILGQDWPRVDMSETDEEIKVTAELPGVDKDKIDISVTDDRITIRGEKEEQEEEKKRGYYKLERSYGSFRKSFLLPCEVESEKVDASFRDGILTVILPKSGAARERIKKIPVRAG